MTINWGQPSEATTTSFRANRNRHQHHRRSQENRPDLLGALGKTFQDFCRTTKVNGPYYLQKEVTKGWARAIWTVIPNVLFATGLVLVSSLWSRYMSSPTRMTIGKPLSITDVPFPAVTICHTQSVISYKAEEFAERIKYPSGITKEKLLAALPALGVFTEHQWTLPNTEDMALVTSVLHLNNISIFSAVVQLGKTCEDFLVECRFAGKSFPCFQNHNYLTWTTTTSHFGTCCSFHYHPLSENFQPFAANAFGIEGSLTVVGSGYPLIADGQSGIMYSSGFLSMIHHPLDFAMETSPTVLLAPHRETFVAVHPTDIRCSDQVLALPETQRKCINPADYDYADPYRQSSCILDCIRANVHQTCQCHPFYLPEKAIYGRNKPIRECSLVDGLCLVKNYAKFKMTHCDCLPPCNDVSYKVSSFSVDIEAGQNNSISTIYRSTNITEFEFIAHFYMAKQIVPTNNRIVVMSWITLLSNLGGVFSLCMGISVISLIEIVYFLGIRVRYHYVQDQKNRVAQMSTATTNVVQVLQLAREATTTTKAKTKSTSDGGGGAAAWDESGWQREHRVVMMTRPTAGGKRF